MNISSFILFALSVGERVVYDMHVRRLVCMYDVMMAMQACVHEQERVFFSRRKKKNFRFQKLECCLFYELSHDMYSVPKKVGQSFLLFSFTVTGTSPQNMMFMYVYVTALSLQAGTACARHLDC